MSGEGGVAAVLCRPGGETRHAVTDAIHVGNLASSTDAAAIPVYISLQARLQELNASSGAAAPVEGGVWLMGGDVAKFATSTGAARL